MDEGGREGRRWRARERPIAPPPDIMTEGVRERVRIVGLNIHNKRQKKRHKSVVFG